MKHAHLPHLKNHLIEEKKCGDWQTGSLWIYVYNNTIYKISYLRSKSKHINIDRM